MCHFTYIRITFKKDRIGLLMEGSQVGEKVVVYILDADVYYDPS